MILLKVEGEYRSSPACVVSDILFGPCPFIDSGIQYGETKIGKKYSLNGANKMMKAAVLDKLQVTAFAEL